MTFYFAWAEAGDSFDPKIHLREDEEVVCLEILHEEGEFPVAFLQIKNLKNVSQPRLFIACKMNNRIELLFDGWRRDLPLEMRGDLQTLELTAESPQSVEGLRKAQQALKEGPAWEPLVVPDHAHEDLDEILDSQPLLPHWSRQGEGVTFSHIIKGRHCLDLGRNFFRGSLKTILKPMPFSWVTIEASVEWVQHYDGVADLASVVAPQGLLSTLTGEDLVKRWWPPNTPLKNSGYTILKSALISVEPPNSGALGLYPCTSLPFQTRRGTRTLPRYWFKPQLMVQWNYRQKREEKFHLTLRKSEQGAGKHLRLKLQNVNGQMDRGLSSFFLTSRGQKVAENLVLRAHTYLLASHRVFEVTVQAPFEELISLSCDHDARIEDSQFSAGYMVGKVIKYRLVVEGTTGHKFGEVKIACLLDEKGLDVPVLKDYGRQIPTQGILNPHLLGSQELVTKVEMIHAVDEQNAVLSGQTFEGISQAFRRVQDHFTRIRLELKDLRATDVLTHVIEGEIE